MNYKNAFHLFQTLLEEGDENLEQRLLNLISSEHEFFNESSKLIAAYQANKKATLVNDLINNQAENLADDSQVHELLNTQVAQYKLTKKLGQGGMGVVYLGERNDGQLQQKVAIKFIFPSIAALAGENFLQREAQHLANLTHVNIAKIFTVDTTDDELPYMVMEYVEGVPIDQYCDDNKLDLTTRLKLFQKVCSAVHEAHQNMVIHADIKPSNILVDKQGEPKLMDFGIARRVNQAIDEDTNNAELRKQYLQAVSHDFASPEQIEGKQLTAATDVFSLGKMLPFIFKSDFPELNSIINKAIRTELQYRYQSTLELAQRLKSLQKGYPIKEFSNDFFYRTLKLFKRNVVATVLSFTFASCVFIGASYLYFQNVKLNEQVSISQEVTNFLTDLFESSDIDMHTTMTVKELIKESEKRVKGRVWKSKRVKAHILKAIAKVYQGQGDLKEAEQLYLEAFPLFDAKDEIEVIIAKNELAQVYIALSDFKNARDILENIVNEKPKGKVLFETYNLLGLLNHSEGQYIQSRKYYNDALLGLENLDEISLFMISTIHGNIGASYMMEDENEKALVHFEKALKIDYGMYKSSVHPRIALHLQQLGSIQADLGQYDKGLMNLKNALDMYTQIAPNGHPRENAVLNNISVIYGRDLKQPEEALKYLKLSLAAYRKGKSEDSIGLAIIHHNIAANNRDAEKYQEALKSHEKALTIIDNLKVEGYVKALMLASYGETLAKNQNAKEAIENLSLAINILREIKPESSKIAKFEKMLENIKISNIL
ncbi:MAG: serine/threonine-protein kinase [Colwellia sp.]